MKNKKKLLISLFFALSFSAFSLSAVSCRESGDTENSGNSISNSSSSSEDTVEEYGEVGIYYFDADSEEYLISLNGGTFTLLIDNETQVGTYTYDGETLQLVFAGQTDVTVASLKDGVLVLQYNGGTYRFLKKISYQVSYEVNGGSAVASSSVLNGKTLSKPEDPVKDGYNFVGWYEDSAFTSPFAFDVQPVIGNITLYARFEKGEAGQDEYEVSFFVDGTVYTSKKTVGGKLYDLPVPVKEGSTFVGWWLSDYQDAEKLTCKYDEQSIGQNTSLYAVWDDDSPKISVTSTGVSWTAKGVNNRYSVRITAPDGTVSTPMNDGATKYDYDFASLAAGDYKVEVTVNDKTTSVAYYKNKALAKVSLFSVAEPSMLIFNAVEHAEKYLITVDCGNEEHQHTLFDNGNSTNFNFANCKMQEGGITFTVQAVATGYVTSQSEVFTYSRDLESVTGLKLDEKSGKILWNKVENATSYVVEVENAGKTIAVNVGTATSYSVKGYQGDVTVKVYPIAEGYNSSAAELTYTGTKLASPDNITVAGTTVSWASVDGALKYNVKVGAKVYETESNSFTLTDEYYVEGQEEYDVSIQAVGDTDAKNSFYSDEVIVRRATMCDLLVYEKGYISWEYVVDAYRYGIKVNDGEEISVAAGTNQYKVALTKEGVNTISVCYYNKYDQPSEWVSVNVYAYSITFDVRGGSAVATQYYAIGDELALPDPTFEGYDFAGWYNVPGGPENNGAKYENENFQSGGNTILYAYWTPKAYTITFIVDENGTIEEQEFVVYYKRGYTLPVAVCNDYTKTFGGWYTEANAKGFKYTDPNGKSLDVWKDTKDMVLYAGWINVLTYDLITESDGVTQSYEVSGNKDGISYVTYVKIPAQYNGLAVTSVKDGAFSGCSNLLQIDIPDTIKSIHIGSNGGYGDDSAFYGCSKLQEVNIYCVDGEHTENSKHEVLYESVDGVLLYNNPITGTGKEIKYFPQAKAGAYRIPDGVETIPLNTFKNAKISELVVPASVKKIDAGAFKSSKITSVVFEEAAEGVAEVPLTLGAGAFESCSYLTSAVLPTRLEGFNENVFTSCSSLVSVKVSGTGGNYADIDGVLFNANKTELVYCPKAREGSYTIPLGVSVIKEGAFKGCKYLTEIVIPGYVTTIEKEAFKSCSALTSLSFLGEEGDPYLSIGESAFYSCTVLTEVTLPANLKVLAKNAFGNTKLLTKVYVNATTELQFENGAFADTANKTYVTDLYLGANVEVVDIPGVFGAATLARVDVDVNNLNYSAKDGVLFNKDVTKIVYYPSAKKGDYVIPSTVTEIGAGVFEGKVHIAKITIGKQVTVIGERAFADCTNLSKIVFEEGGSDELTIGASAFYKCSALTSVKLPERLISIGESAFKESRSIKEIILPEGLKEIGDNAFAFVNRLVSITIPASVEKIGAYSEDGNLESIATVFTYTTDLTAINVAEGNLYFASKDGVLYGKKDGVVTDLYFAPQNVGGVVSVYNTVTRIWAEAFKNNKAITQIVFEGAGNDVEVGAEAFYSCTTLEKVTLPNGLKTMGEGMFYGCKKLTEIVIPNSVTKMENGAFSGCEALTTVTFEDGGEETLVFAEGTKVTSTQGVVTYTGVFAGCKALTIVEFPERPVQLGKYSFAACSALKTVGLSSTISVIPNGCFEQCTSLSELNWAEDGAVTSIGEYAFDHTALVELILPNTVTSIGKDAFYSSQLETVTISAGLQTISNYTFGYNKNLKQITFAKNDDGTRALDTIEDDSFIGCSSLESVEIPAGVVKIGAYAFSGCKALSSVTFEKGGNLGNIGNYAFQNTALTEFRCPDTSAEELKLGTYLFSGCKELTYVYLTKNVASIDNVFAKCYSITEIEIEDGSENFKESNDMPYIMNLDGTAIRYIYGNIKGEIIIPEGVTEIGLSAFEGQVGLTKITLPKSLKVIGKSAFSKCMQLKEVVYADAANGALESIGQNAFQYCTALESIVLPDSVTSVGTYAFADCTSLDDVTLSKNLTKLSASLFSGCTALKSIDLSYVTNMGGNTVFQNSGLETVTLPENLTITSISSSHSYFLNCKSLTTVYMSESLTTLVNQMFNGCTSLTTIKTYDAEGNIRGEDGVITLPRGLTTIGYSFPNCTSIESILMPEGVMTLGSSSGVFNNCTSLTTIKVYDKEGNVIGEDGKVLLPDSIKTLGCVFKECPAITSITMKNAVATALAGSTFYKCTALTEVILPDGLTTFKASEFEGCTALTSITIPAKVNVFGNKVFTGCTSLEEVILSDSIKTFGNYVFDGCTALKTIKTIDKNGVIAGEKDKVILPSALTFMGTYTFQNATSIEHVTIPSNVKMLGASATSCLYNSKSYVFSGCTGLKKVVLHENLAKIGACVFLNCSSLETVENADKLALIGYQAFNGCASLKEITLPALKDIGSSYSMFLNCTSLESVILNEELTSLASTMFKGCTSLKTMKTIDASGNVKGKDGVITLSDKLTFMGTNTFQSSGIEKIVIPASITNIGKSETKFGATDDSYVFDGCEALTSVTLPANLQTIGGYTFRNCSALTDINLPESLTAIYRSAFEGTTSLKSVTLPVSLSALGESAFKASGIQSIVIPESISALPSYVFMNSALTSLTLPSEAELTIGGGAFAGTRLTTVHIPAGVTSLGNYAFGWCRSLTGFTVDSNNAAYKAGSDGALYTIDNTLVTYPAGASGVVELESGVTISAYAFYGCNKIQGVILPDSLTKIGNYAFYYSGIVHMDIPEGVTEIGDRAFSECSNLRTISIPEGVTAIGDYAFYNASSLISVVIPESVVSLGDSVFRSCASLTSAQISEGVETIGVYAFYETGLESIKLPDSLKELGYYSFKNCTSLTSAVLGKGLVELDNQMFAGCTSLSSVVLSEGLITIGTNVFDGCVALESITIPASVETIKDKAFLNCTSLKSVTFNEGLLSIGNYAFDGCTSLSEVVLPESVTTIGTYAFRNCTSLQAVMFNEGLLSIGNYAFDGCTSLLEAELPESLTTLGTYVFRNCTSLVSAKVGGNVTKVPDYSFNGCTSLENVTLSNGLLTISQYAFAGCEKLSNVDLPDTLTYLGAYAFSDCTALTSVVLPEGLETLMNGVFLNSGVTEIVIPESVVTMQAKDWMSTQTIYIKASRYVFGTTWHSGCAAKIVWEYVEE